MIPLSLYIHMPWCVRRCHYCDFNSCAVDGENNLPEQEYIEALVLDFKQDLMKIAGRKIESIFIGGGTPSLFKPKKIGELLDVIHKLAQVNSNAEITMEANPGTFDARRIKDFYSVGINRLSVGVQSFQDDKLKKLGRIHSADIAKQAISYAYQAGFENINLDLMHGLPGQTIADALHDLEIAIQFKPRHISWYQLTIEHGTFFAQQSPGLPDEDVLYEIQKQGKHLLAKYGYHQYEISAYCHEGCQCQHNLNYWQFGDYLGVGAGAHSKITTNGEVTRFWKTKQPYNYMRGDFTEDGEIIAKIDLPLEFMMNALRLIDGASITLFKERTGLDLSKIAREIELAQNKNLLEIKNKIIKATDLGNKFLNDCLECFI
jgi:putative oxygen-independent coproporphyrinogen III oxidase